MLMTVEGLETWLLDRNQADRIIAETLETHEVEDWPLPNYLLEELETLAAIKTPNQGQVDEVRIPLTNWFRQRRADLTGSDGLIGG